MCFEVQNINNAIIFLSVDPPCKPSSVTISVASEDSLLVRFIEPLDENVIVSKYKSEYQRIWQTNCSVSLCKKSCNNIGWLAD